MVSIYKCCLQFSNSRAVWESVSVTFLAIFCWIHRVTISEFHKWLWTIDQYRHHISGNFVNTWSVYNPGGVTILLATSCKGNQTKVLNPWATWTCLKALLYFTLLWQGWKITKLDILMLRVVFWLSTSYKGFVAHCWLLSQGLSNFCLLTKC